MRGSKILSTLQNTLEKSNYYKRSLIVVLVIFLKKKSMLAFINPFSLNECNILKMPSTSGTKANSILKMKFNELSLFSSSSEMIGVWHSLPREHFPEMRKLAQSYTCLFGLPTDASSHFLLLK